MNEELRVKEGKNKKMHINFFNVFDDNIWGINKVERLVIWG